MTDTAGADFEALLAEAVAAVLAFNDAEQRYDEALRQLDAGAVRLGVSGERLLLMDAIDSARAARAQPPQRAASEGETR